MTTTVASKVSLKYRHTIGLCTMEGRGFMFPAGTAIGADGRLYTVSRGLTADSRTPRITVYDLDSAFFGTFGSFGEGEGQFTWPSAIAVDDTGLIYVSDEYTNRINVFDPDGSAVRCWGSQGSLQGELDGPSGMAFDSTGDLWVSDHRNHRIQKFTKNGDLINCFGNLGSGNGQLNLPWGIAVNSDDDVYVADWRNDRVVRFSGDGEFRRAYGSSGRGNGQFHRPSDVAVDGEGRIYVADWGNERVQVLGPDGGFVAQLRGEATPSKWAEDFLATNVEEAEARAKADLEPDLEQFGGDPHEESAHIEKFFWGPVSIVLDDDGRLYVTESNRHRVQVYHRDI